MAQKVRELWAKIGEKYITEKTVFAILFAAFVVMLTPMLMIAFYNAPSADDFSNGISTHQTWAMTHSLIQVLQAAFQNAAQGYIDWQGSFAANFLFALQPAIFGERGYFLTTFIMLAALGGGTVWLSVVIFHRLLKATRYQAGIVCIVLLAAFTQLVPYPTEAFYWYVGAVYYTFFSGVALIVYANTAYAVFGPQDLRPRWRQSLGVLGTALLSAAVGNSNLATGLLTALLFGLALFAAFLKKRPQKYKILVPAVFFFAAFLANVAAPGNAKRQAAIQYEPNVVSAIWNSFNYALEYAQDWFTPLLFCLLAFLLPLFWYALENSDFSFPYPAMVTFGSFCLFSAMFCPHLYAAGVPGPGRYLDAVFYVFVILLIGNEFYILGYVRNWLIKRGEIRAKAGKEACYSLKLVICFAFAAACAFVFTCRNVHVTSYHAAAELLDGSASAYYEVNQARFALLKDESKKDVVLPRYQEKMPYTIFRGDISADPEDILYWRNTAMAGYYEKDSVTLEPPAP